MNRERAIDIVEIVLRDYAQWISTTKNGKKYEEEVLDVVKYIKENLK